MQTHCPTALAPNLSARPALASSSLRRRVFRVRRGNEHSSSSAQSASETQAMREETHVEAQSYEETKHLLHEPSAAPSCLIAGAGPTRANGTGAPRRRPWRARRRRGRDDQFPDHRLGTESARGAGEIRLWAGVRGQGCASSKNLPVRATTYRRRDGRDRCSRSGTLPPWVTPRVCGEGLMVRASDGRRQSEAA